MTPTDLSLFRIDETLAQLFSLREEMLAEGEDTAAVEAEIAQYMQALPQKTSGVCAIFRMWRSQVNAIKAEENRLADLRRRIEAHEERLKAYVAEILERQPEPKKGCKKLVGVDGSQLMLKGNGGLQPLEVDIERLPHWYFDVSVTMPVEAWNAVCAEVQRWCDTVSVGSPMPANSRIRNALARPCPDCDGDGIAESGVDGSAQHDVTERKCPTCGGTGLAGVPGAALLERGKHVEVR